jgi:hypothetical protein
MLVLDGVLDLAASTLCTGRTSGWLQMNRLSSRNNQLKFKNSRNLLIILEEFMEYTPTEQSKSKRCQHVTGWI